VAGVSVDAIKRIDEAQAEPVKKALRELLLSYLPQMADDPEALRQVIHTYSLAMILGNELCVEDFKKCDFDGIGPLAPGGKSEADLAADGKPFSLGSSSHCLIVGIQNPEVGIAGSHKFIPELRRAAGMFRAKSASGKRSIVDEAIEKTPGYLRDIAVTATKEVCGEVLELNGGIPTDGNSFIIYGLSEFNYEPTLMSEIRKSVVEVVKENGFGINSAQPFSIDRLGKRTQVIYGGRNHPTYSVPTVIPVK